MQQIVKIKFGSHLYGTNTPTSDVDYKTVYIPAARDILLQRVKGSVKTHSRAKKEGEKNLPGDTDDECYSLHRFLDLAAQGQTVAIDMLFTPEPLTTSALWRTIQDNRYRLLTKKSAAFVGYCRTQANKYGIKGSRVASARAAMVRFDALTALHGSAAKVGQFFGPEDETIDEHTRTLRKNTPNGNVERYFECCNKLVGFRNTIKEAATMYRRMYEGFGARAKMAESNEGIDWKALSHAVRVGREALELFRNHSITFPLPYASHILAIKQGRLPYPAVAEEIEELLRLVEETSVTSTLRDEPDYAFIDDLVASVYESQIRQEFKS